jgi:hypothetical protein
MKLQEWAKTYGVNPIINDTKAATVTSQPGTVAHQLLFDLSDYKVSSVTGPIVWLVPKRPAFRLEVCKGGGWVQTAEANVGHLQTLMALAFSTLRNGRDILAVRILDDGGEQRLHLGILE